MNYWANTTAKLQQFFVAIEKYLVVEIMQNYCVVARRNKNLFPMFDEFRSIYHAHFIVTEDDLNSSLRNEPFGKPALRVTTIRNLKALKVFYGVFVKAVALRMRVGTRELIRIPRSIGTQPASA